MSRVLIIEDEEMVRITLRMMLERAGHDVAEAANGREGLERLREYPADIVITDIIMPEMDGVETTIQIRAKFPGVGIIAISGGGRIRNMDFLGQARSIGADVSLAKPFTNQQLMEALAEAAAASLKSS